MHDVAIIEMEQKQTGQFFPSFTPSFIFLSFTVTFMGQGEERHMNYNSRQAGTQAQS
jgi:hypothetical protein